VRNELPILLHRCNSSKKSEEDSRFDFGIVMFLDIIISRPTIDNGDKQEIDQQLFNRKLISRKIRHRQPLLK